MALETRFNTLPHFDFSPLAPCCLLVASASSLVITNLAARGLFVEAAPPAPSPPVLAPPWGEHSPGTAPVLFPRTSCGHCALSAPCHPFHMGTLGVIIKKSPFVLSLLRAV